MKLVSVNVGLPRLLGWKGATFKTGIFKKPVDGRIMLRETNLDGDRQADLSVHGGVNKAAYVYPSEHYSFWRGELPQEELPWGSFGENFTTEGLLETNVCMGDQYRVGSAVVKVTTPRLPCFKLAAKFQRDNMIERFLRSGHSGFYFSVIQEGEIGAGDEFHFLDPQRDHRRVQPSLHLPCAGSRFAQTRGRSQQPARKLARALSHPDRSRPRKAADLKGCRACGSLEAGMITDVLHRLANHCQSLSRDEARTVMTEILTGKCTDAQIAALLVALHMKGETVEEIVGLAEAIRAAATPLELHSNSVLDASGTGRDALVDTCGTGGDASGTFNISTATAFVAAGAGVRVAKHGNRSVTSKCGSADVMEALGVNINLPPARIAACLDKVGIAFLFAPAIHSAMKYVQSVRRELRLRTVFNLLGPLTNPAQATCQVVGVYSSDLVEKLAEALSMLGLHRALVVHGNDGLDEITITGPTRVGEVREGRVHTYEVTPEECGLRRAALDEIAGGDAAMNATLIRDVLSGKKSARRDVVLLNAAAALVASGRADHLRDAVPFAAKAIDSGAALEKLQALIAFSTL